MLVEITERAMAHTGSTHYLCFVYPQFLILFLPGASTVLIGIPFVQRMLVRCD